MPIVDMVMPKMGESVQEGTVIEWKVAVGDAVDKDQILLDIATDKVDTEVPSPAGGTITEILVGPDQTVEVGSVIARINTNGTSAPPPAAPAAEAPAKPVAQAVPQPAAAAPSAPAAGSGAIVKMVMPKMGESVQEGTVISWKVGVGDSVEKDQILLDIATDKVDTEVPSPASGTIAEILVGPDETVEVGAVIAHIATGAPAATSVAAPAAASPAPAASAPPAKSTNSQPTTVVVGTITEIPRRDGEHFFSPLVRRIAKENGVTLEELRALNGSGQGGRITKANLQEYIANRGSSAPAPKATAPVAAASASASAPTPALAKAVGDGKKTLEQLGLDPSRVRVEKMNFMRKKIAQHMRESLDTSAHVYQVHECDMTRVVELRDQVKDEFKKSYGFSLTFTSFIIWAATRALRQFPLVGSRLNGDEIIIPDYVNFGVAVSLPNNGLVVPKIKSCEDLTITGIQRRLNELAAKARENKLSPDDLSGGTFTLTNMGGYGSVFGMPIISQPEVAILGCGAVQQRAVIKSGGIAVRWMMYNALSFDHRIIDGKLAADFLNAITYEIENMNPSMVGFDRRKGE